MHLHNDVLARDHNPTPTCSGQQPPHHRKRWPIVTLFLLFQIPLLLLLLYFGPSPLWWRAEYNLVAITAWCVLCRYFWRAAAHCMACSLFCTFVVWVLPLLPGLCVLAAQFAGMVKP